MPSASVKAHARPPPPPPRPPRPARAVALRQGRRGGVGWGRVLQEAGRTPYNPRSVQTVIQEMQECYDRHGIREIDIFDYEFLINRKRSLEICREMQKQKLDILWACRARIDSVDDELLKEMAASGCGRIYYGIEAGDLLTTASIPGYAMKATDPLRSQGAILGKAMESLEKGQKGQILVLVTLQ